MEDFFREVINKLTAILTFTVGSPAILFKHFLHIKTFFLNSLFARKCHTVPGIKEDIL